MILIQRPNESHAKYMHRMQKDCPWKQYQDKWGKLHFKPPGPGPFRRGRDCPQSDSAKRTARNQKRKVKAEERRAQDVKRDREDPVGAGEVYARRELEAAENERLAATRRYELSKRMKAHACGNRPVHIQSEPGTRLGPFSVAPGEDGGDGGPAM